MRSTTQILTGHRPQAATPFQPCSSPQVKACPVVHARSLPEDVTPTAVSYVEPPTTSPRLLYQVSEQNCCSQVASTSSSVPDFASIATNPATWAALAAAGLTVAAIKQVYDTPSRTYDNNVGKEYDAWTEEGILEYYWGEHIHLGYYSDEERKKGAFKKSFKKAKYDFIDEMFKFSESKPPKRILDVGCGFGGTSRYLAKMFPDAQVEGITLSPKQVQRGTELAKEQSVSNVHFQVMDALNMTWEDESFDLVWACESGEHMPDKKKYVEEMTRVLKPGGTLVIACWCQREETPEKPFTDSDRSALQFLYDEWAHPYFISIQEFCRLMQGTGKMQGVKGENWTAQTIDSWLHNIWVGILDPWIVVFKGPYIWYKTTREIITTVRMHMAFDSGLMEYGMIRGTKVPKPEQLKEDSSNQLQPERVLVGSSV